MLDQVWLCAYL